jgi:chemotaxis methyl-accepting protein methylase
LNDKDLQNEALDGFFQTKNNWKGTIDFKKKAFAIIENEVLHEMFDVIFFVLIYFSLHTQNSSVSTISEYFTADTNTVTCGITEQKKVFRIFLFFHT